MAGVTARQGLTTILTREPGDRRELPTPTPFAIKGGVMQSCFRFFAVFLFSAAALASELTVKVVDPQSASVPGAQVELFAKDSDRPAAVLTTSGLGVAHFRDVPSGALRVHVLAPGFAEQWTPVSSPATEVTVPLHLAVQTETVVVTATRTPVPTDESGDAVETLSGAQLDTMRPVAANDALRFLPGAVVATAGQRGGLVILVRARRRFALQQSHRGWRCRQ